MNDEQTRTRFEGLLLPLMNDAYNLARWLMKDQEDAEDMVQESFLSDCSGPGYRRRAAFRRNARWAAIECLGNHRSGARRRPALLSGCKLGFCGERPLLRCGNLRPIAMERARSGIRVPGGKFHRIIFYRRPICSVFAGDPSGTGPEHSICFFYLCYTGADTVIGLKELRLRPCSLGLLFTSMGAGSVFSAVFVLPRARKRLRSNTLFVLGNLLVVLVYVPMAFVRQRELFLAVAALAVAGWTLSASELRVAAQRAMPSWAQVA
jgi:hypothetical protein